jgi:hypothetical protein
MAQPAETVTAETVMFRVQFMDGFVRTYKVPTTMTGGEFIRDFAKEYPKHRLTMYESARFEPQDTFFAYPIINPSHKDIIFFWQKIEVFVSKDNKR